MKLTQKQKNNILDCAADLIDKRIHLSMCSAMTYAIEAHISYTFPNIRYSSSRMDILHSIKSDKFPKFNRKNFNNFAIRNNPRLEEDINHRTAINAALWAELAEMQIRIDFLKSLKQ